MSILSSETQTSSVCRVHSRDVAECARDVQDAGCTDARMGVWYGRSYESRGTDCGAPEPQDVQGAILGGQLRGLPRAGTKKPAHDAQRVSAFVRHGALAWRRGVHRQQEE